MRNFTWRTAVAGGFVVAAAFTGGHARAEDPSSVAIEDFVFSPRVLTVPAGTTVTWTNRDEETHTITAVGGTFGSGGLAHDEHFAQAFPRPGRYEYFCALHPHMKATVIVR